VIQSPARKRLLIDRICLLDKASKVLLNIVIDEDEKDLVERVFDIEDMGEIEALAKEIIDRDIHLLREMKQPETIKMFELDQSRDDPQPKNGDENEPTGEQMESEDSTDENSSGNQETEEEDAEENENGSGKAGEEEEEEEQSSEGSSGSSEEGDEEEELNEDDKSSGSSDPEKDSDDDEEEDGNLSGEQAGPSDDDEAVEDDGESVLKPSEEMDAYEKQLSDCADRTNSNDVIKHVSYLPEFSDKIIDSCVMDHKDTLNFFDKKSTIY
jgi:hypothetical protein